jgi:MoxR-like ATPase
VARKSIEIAQDIVALLKARTSFIWIVTREEARVESFLLEAAAAADYAPYTWDCGQGVADMQGNVLLDRFAAEPGPGNDPGTIIDAIGNYARGRQPIRNLRTTRNFWILRDMAAWVTAPIGLQTQRQLRNVVRYIPGVEANNAQAVVVLSTSAEVPAELADHATVIEWPLPDRDDLAAILEASVANLPEDVRKDALSTDAREAAIDAAAGLSEEEAASCFARSLVQYKRIDHLMVAQEKKRVISRGMLEWFDPIPGGLAAVGGLGNLKSWLMQRESAFTIEAREYGLPAPRGALLVGFPGCGKTLIAKAIATAWQVPLLKLDLNALKSKFVGESEQNLRRTLKIIEAIGPCVVLADEIEKALAGATQGAADGGVSSDALGTLLTWMQERRGQAFIVATSNDISKLPPELLRKGRFDEIWFVDVPTLEERVEIVKATLASHGRKSAKIDLMAVAEACSDFTGAEIAALVPDAMFTAFADKKREVTTKDLLAAADTVEPSTKTNEKLIELRAWQQKNRIRLASGSSKQDKANKTVRRQRAVEL